ncbi:ABC transporter permease [Phytoactinopolyspora halophila]|uniref:ABC transporter permease n=1 Tax=Phytoactinopolyspora halophila TaxID=1981511 RepID=UPI001B8D33CB|nr:ABC transporter permease [Phytoactinopolyspora halophila]
MVSDRVGTRGTENAAAGHEPSRPASPRGDVTGWGRVIGTALGVSLLVGFLVTIFAWPVSETQPRDLPLAVVGPPEAVQQFSSETGAAMPGAFDVTAVPDDESARELIRDREVYGAVVLDPESPPELLVASAAGPAVARLLENVLGQMVAQESAQESGGTTLAVDDVVAVPEDDPRGSVFSVAAFPMVMGGMLVGTVLSFGVAGVWRRVAGALVAAPLAGLTATLVVQGWLGALQGSYWANAGVIALVVAAISTTLIGLHAILGQPGIGIGAFVMLLLGNPLSGVTSAPEMLPAGWSDLGQMLPAGAGATLLRSTAFFDGAAAGGPALVLAAWVAAGLVLVVLGRTLRRPAGDHAGASGESTSPGAPAAP